MLGFCGDVLSRYEWHTFFLLCLGTEPLYSPASEALDNHPPSEGLLDLEAPADLKFLSLGSPLATGSFPHSISLVTERDK